MNKTSLITGLIIMTLVLSGCSALTSANSFGGAAGARILTPEAKLAIGTLKLDATKQAVDPAMASKLLPLWQLLHQLNSTSSAAPQEVAAVLDQIRSIMSPDQTAAIEAMQISGADMFAAFQQGQANGAGGQSTNSARSSSGTGGSNRGGGQGFVFFGGGAPGGGTFPGGGNRNGGTGTAAPQNGTATPRSGASGNAINLILVNQVIRLLESKVGS